MSSNTRNCGQREREGEIIIMNTNVLPYIICRKEWKRLIEMLQDINLATLNDKLAIPFGEEYYLNKEFMDTVSFYVYRK